MPRRRGASLKRTLLLAFLVTSLAPLALVSAVSYHYAKENLRAAAYESVAANVEERARFINDWFHYRFIDLESQATSYGNAQFLSDLCEAFEASGKEVGEFVGSYPWAAIVEEQGADIKSFRRMYGYYDALLIDTAGNILFSAAQESDLGTNLFLGPLAETHFSLACQEALDTGRATFSDFDRYAPLDNRVAGFLISLVVDDDGEKLGLFAVQLQVEKIEGVVQKRAGPSTGVSYLVGYSPGLGVTLRSPPDTDGPRENEVGSRGPGVGTSSDYLDRLVDTEQTREWLAKHGPNGSGDSQVPEVASIYEGPEANRVLGIHRNIAIGKVNWGLIAEIDERQAFARARQLGIVVAGLISVTGFLVVVVAVSTTRRIAGPITELSKAASLVAQGDLNQRIDTAATNEIGELAYSFNWMVSNLKLLFGELSNQKDAVDKHAIVSVADIEGNITYVNDRFCEISKYSRDELIGQNHRIIKSDEHDAAFFRHMWNTICSGRVFSGEVKNRAKDGSFYWTRATIVPFKDENGKITRYVAIRTDITKIKRAEERLHEAARQQERESWIKTGRAGIGDQMRGAEEVALLARNVVTYIAKYVGAQIGAFYVSDGERRLKLGGSYAFLAQTRRVDAFDVGEGLVGQVALEQEHIVLTNVPDDYVVVKSGLGAAPPRNILVWPVVAGGKVKGVIELGSYEPFQDRALEFLNQATENIAIAVDAAQSRRRLRELLLRSQAQSEQLRVKTDVLQAREEELRNSNRHLAEKTAKLQSSEEALQDQRKTLQAVNEELREKTKSLQAQKSQLEQAKREVEDKAEEAARASKCKSEFLANMSHELRTPMNSIIGFTDRLLSKELGDSMGQRDLQALEIVERNAKHLLELLNSILDLSKIEAGRMEVNLSQFDLVDAIREVNTYVASLVDGKPIELKAELPETPIYVQADRTKIGQVLSNLISNGIKYTEEGAVTVSICRSEDEWLGPVTRVSVSDTGIGIKKEDLSQLFTKFSQLDSSTSRVVGGTGLGLCIALQFAEMHGGRIEVESEFGEGSEFTFVLPLDVRSGSATNMQTTSPVSHAPGGICGTTVVSRPLNATAQQDVPGGITILCVDDEPDSLELLRVSFVDAGYNVLLADGHDAAVAQARAHRPDLICLDLRMPGKDGFDVMEDLQADATLASIPVIVVSVSSSESQARAAGARYYLPKPVDVQELRTTVRHILAEGDTKILVVEDDPDALRLASTTLTAAGMDVSLATNGREALDRLSESLPSVILLDLMMPVMDGFELLDHLQRDPLYRDIPVVVLSAKTLTQTESDKLRQVSQAILAKGRSTSEQLVDTLLQVLVPKRREMEGASA